MKKSIVWTAIIGLLAGAILTWAANPKARVVRQPLVAPGQHDQYYAITSGGPRGDLRVVGIPSMRVLRTIPVFEARPGYDYGASNMPGLASGNWGDTHHPQLSMTGGKYDGRWAFINNKGGAQVARIDLKTWKTDKIVTIPNIQAAHGLAISANSKYLAVNGEFLLPMPDNPKSPASQYMMVETFIDPATMKIDFQVMDNQTDIADWGKNDNWFYATVYNSEKGMTEAQMITNQYDYVAAFHLPALEKALAKGEYQVINGVKVIDPYTVAGGIEYVQHGQPKKNNGALVYYTQVPKNPHGVNVTPDGKYVIADGKLSPTVSIIDTKTLQVVAEPYIGLGPLHTTFDNRGNAYTSNFIDSTIVKWNIAKAVAGDPHYIVQKLTVHYSPGHTAAVEARTVAPAGNWLLALNKFSKETFLHVGPDFPDNDELIDISGNQMRLVYQGAEVHEPHDAVFLPADLISQQPNP